MKDPFNLFIEDSVYYTQNQYYGLIRKTKRLFFDSLINKRPLNEFRAEAQKIWGNIDHSYMEQRLEELEKMVSATNLAGKPIINPDAAFKQVFELTPESRFAEVEAQYEKVISNYYKGRLKTLNNGIVDETTYLTDLVKKYDSIQAIIPYYNKDGTIRSYHDIASYNSMLYNTNLNRAGWNRTLFDSNLLGNDLVYLPAHPGACPLCMEWQGKVYSISGKTPGYPKQEEAIDGGVGHPNCKHQWLIYWDNSQIQEDTYNSPEWEEYYKNKQKAQSMELERSRLKNDRAILQQVGNYGEVDKVNAKIKALNSKISEIKPKNYPTIIENKPIVKDIPKISIEDINPVKPSVAIPKAEVRQVSKELVDNFNKGLEDLANRYPEALEYAGKLNYTKVSNYNGTGGLTEIGAKFKKDGYDIYGYTSYYNKITIRARESYNTLDKYKEQVKYQYDKLWNSTNNPNHVIYHEYGHALANNLSFKMGNDKTLINDLNAFNYKRYTRENTQDLNRILRGLATHKADTEIINDTVKIYNESNGSSLTFEEIFRNKVSKYGASSKSEGFAELFAKVMNNDDDEITLIFKGVLDNKIRELR